LGARKGSKGPLQRDTKQAEIIKSKVKKSSIDYRKGETLNKSYPSVGKKGSIAGAKGATIGPSNSNNKKMSLSSTTHSLVLELAPYFPNCTKEQIEQQLEVCFVLFCFVLFCVFFF
jgi:hypothetical protein